MSSINQIASVLTSITKSTTNNNINSNKADNKNKPENQTNENAVIHKNLQSYKPDMEKIKNMKAETDQRMIDLFTNTVSHGFLKQLGGLRGALEKIINGEKVEGLDIEINEETILKAQEDIAPEGYWSPEKTSDRFLEFAKALSGNDPSKANLLLDAFKEGYRKAEELWGGELPEISKKTYDLTLEKFEEWSSHNNGE